MKDFRNMDESELKAALVFAELLAERAPIMQGGSVGSFSTKDDADQEADYIEEARRAAAEYARARKEGKRSHEYPQDSEMARLGVSEALDFLKRRRASKLKH